MTRLQRSHPTVKRLLAEAPPRKRSTIAELKQWYGAHQAGVLPGLALLDARADRSGDPSWQNSSPIVRGPTWSMYVARADRFSPREREDRRAAKDRRFRRSLRARRAREERERAMLVHIADRYHHTVKRCYASRYATWGTVASRKQEWPYKGHMKDYPRIYRCPGVRRDENTGEITIETYRREIIKLPRLPKAIAHAWIDEPHPVGLLACRTNHAGAVACYAPHGKRWVCIHPSIAGVRVPERVVTGDYTVADALAETNQEVRRIMLQRLPAEQLAAHTGALTEVHRDEFGVLYRDAAGQQRVKVVNSTPESDGSFRDYWLDVPPYVRTAREAVAWTFGLTAEEYVPVAQS